MAKTPRSQPYRFSWPLTPSQVEGIDESFQILFDDIRNGSITINANTQITSGILPYSSGGTNSSTSFTSGSVIFAGTSSFSQDNANLFWDNINKRLGIGTSSPGTALQVNVAAGTGTATNEIKFGDGTYGFLSANTNLITLAAGSGVVELNISQSTGFVGVGMGTTAASDVLEVNGNIILRQNISHADRVFYPNDTAGTVGIVASGSGPTFTSGSGSYAGFRANSYTQNANQRGNCFMAAGLPSSPGAAEGAIWFLTGNDLFRLTIDKNGNVGIGDFHTGNATAYLHIKAGVAAASSAPLKFTSGTNLTTPEAGAIEFTTDDFYATITTGAARKGILLNDGTNLTSGKIPIATTNGRLIDGQTPLSGTKTYYVADSSGGAVTRKLTFINGILTAET